MAASYATAMLGDVGILSRNRKELCAEEAATQGGSNQEPPVPGIRINRHSSCYGGNSGAHRAGQKHIFTMIGGGMVNHDGACGTKEFAVAFTRLISALVLRFALGYAGTTFVAEVNETFRATVGFRIYPPTAGRTFFEFTDSA